MLKLFAVPLAGVLFTGCASEVYVPYPHPTDGATGRVIISLSQPMETVNVVIDGALVAEDKHTERVEIQDVPVGKSKVEVVASAGSRTHSVRRTKIVTVEANRGSTILIDTPPYSSGYWIYKAALWLAAMLPLALASD